jgi:DNA-binding NtrC family response regulator
MSMNILIVDDEAGLRRGLNKRLKVEGYQVYEASDSNEMFEILGRNSIHIILLDLKLAHEDGHTLLSEVKDREPHASVIIITGYGTIKSAVACMKDGAVNYLTKPIDQEMLLATIEKEQQKLHLQTENAGLRQSLDDFVEKERIFAPPQKLPSHVDAIIRKTKDLDVNILISGETGTGKEVTAKRLHFSGEYKDSPFISINCSALNDNLIESELFGHEKGAFTGAEERKQGRFEIAGNGTLFLDEIGDMSLRMQSKLLRVLEERSFERVGGTQKLNAECRVIAASNRDLKREIEEKRFRSDLYYRLNVVEIQLPPLRERKEEIPLFVEEFIAEANREYGKQVDAISRELMERIVDYPWPGNIRQLKNTITNAVLLSDGKTIQSLNIPDLEDPCEGGQETAPSIDLKSYVEQHTERIEREVLERILDEEERNISSAANRLGISRKTLYKKMENYGL